jgi:hypothetical protein
MSRAYITASPCVFGAPGSEYYGSQKKPFVFLWNETVYFGECEHS